MNLMTQPTLSTQRRLINSMSGLPGGDDIVAAARSRLGEAQQNYQQQQQLLAQRQLLKTIRQQQRQAVLSKPPVFDLTAPDTMPKGQLSDWIRRAIKLTPNTGMALAPGIASMIMHESGGNPHAINRWDSNAAAGTPSIGLMQTIVPTFNAYAMKGHRNIYNPVDNIIAGLRYAISRYGKHMVRAGGRHDAAGNYIGY